MEKNPEKGYVALLGWSLNAIDALERFDRRYVVVAPPWAEEYCTQHEIPYMSWDFERINDRSMEIAQKLKEEGVDVAIPLFEETVEWAGAINSVLMDNPRLFGQSILFRDKALMKRRAQLGGIRVGIFEEAHDKSDVVRFLKRVNQTLLKLDGDPNDPIHFKAFDKAGCLGHRVIRTADDVATISDDEFPALMESHLSGWEFAVEAWIKDRKIQFLNISEYVTLGYSVFVDSSLDWGQGLLELRDFMREEGVDRVWLSYFGSALPEGYGIDYVPLPSFFPLLKTPAAGPEPRFAAISATNLVGLYFGADPFGGLRNRPPYRVLGHTVFIYEVNP